MQNERGMNRWSIGDGIIIANKVDETREKEEEEKRDKRQTLDEEIILHTIIEKLIGNGSHRHKSLEINDLGRLKRPI